jgi:hypothetical protein
MKPSEFMDCTYREAKLYAQSFIHNKEQDFKSQVLFFENVTNKLLFNDPNIVKRPQKIRLVDIYKSLFEEEFIKPTTPEEQYKFVMELQEELKREGDNK